MRRIIYLVAFMLVAALLWLPGQQPVTELQAPAPPAENAADPSTRPEVRLDLLPLDDHQATFNPGAPAATDPNAALIPAGEDLSAGPESAPGAETVPQASTAPEVETAPEAETTAAPETTLEADTPAPATAPEANAFVPEATPEAETASPETAAATTPETDAASPEAALPNETAPAAETAAAAPPPASAGEDAAEAANTCTLAVRCDTIWAEEDSVPAAIRAYQPADGVVFYSAAVALEPNDTAFSVLQRELRAAGIPLEFSHTPAYNAIYVEGINHLYEMDAGALSGWLYRINRSSPAVASSGYALKPGDTVEFLYTRDLGRDWGVAIGN